MKAVLLIMAIVLFSYESNAQCLANMTTSTNPFLGGAILFTNQSQADASAIYILDTGDGNVYTLQGMPSSITHTYNAPGTYLYCLSIVDSVTPCYDTFCDSVVVTNGGGGSTCDGFFSANQGGTVFDYDFDITGNATNVSVNHFWTFGDGVNSTLSNPSHTYAALGAYQVCHTVTDINSACSNTYCDSIVIDTVNNQIPCQASYYWWQDSTATQTVIMINNSYGNGPLSYFWDFGDGFTSTQAYPSHQYANTGVFEVCLTIVDSNNPLFTCSSTFCDSVFVTFKASGFTINVYSEAVASTPQMEVNDFAIYPNPANDVLHIDLKNINDVTEVLLFDLQGNLVLKQEVNDTNVTLQIEQLKSGVYLVMAEGYSVQRFVKQ